MHLTELEFLRVGHWANLEPLRFGPRMTVVLGDNEAGKSTAMRAIEALLFGPSRELILPLVSEQLFHAAASLRLPDGREVRWTWRDRKISPAEAAEALRSAAPPETAARFRDLFRLGHDSVRAPASFLSDAGAIGSVLFAASSGASAARLASLEEELQKRLKAAESGAAAKDGLPLHLKRCAELKAALDARADFAAHDVEHGHLREAQERIEALTREIRAIDTDLARLTAFQAGLDEYAALRAAEEELAALEARGPVPRAGWAREIERAVERVGDATSAFRAAEEAARAAEDELAQLPPVPAVVDFANAIDALVRQVGSVGKERDGLAKAQRSLAEARRELCELLAGLGKPADEATLVATAVGLVVPKPRRRVFEKLLEEHRDAENDRKSATGALGAARRALEDAQKTASERAERPVDGLEKARELVIQLAQLEKEAKELENERAEEPAAAKEAAARLGLADKDCAAIAALPVAERPALDAAWLQLSEARGDKSALDKELKTAEGQLEQARAKAAALRSQSGAPPTAESLEAARAERQVAWEAVKSTWSPAWRLGAEAELPELGNAFERTVGAADRVADQRFDGAERVGALDAAEQAAREAGAAVEGLRQRVAGAAESLEAAEARWSSAWSFLPCAPASHQDWLAHHERLCASVSRMRTIETKLASRRAMADDLRADALTLLDGTLSDAGALKTAGALKAAIDSELKRRVAHNKEVTGLHATVEAQRGNLRRAEGELAAAVERLDEASARWAKAIEELPPGIGGAAAEVEGWLAEQERLERLAAEVGRFSSDGKACGDAIDRFESEVGALLAAIRAVDPGLSISDALSPADAIEELKRQAASAGKVRERREKASEQLDERKGDLAGKQKTLEARRLELEALWRESGCAEAWTEELGGRESARADLAHELRGKIEASRKVLAKDWPMGVEAALAGIAGRGRDELELAAHELRGRREDLDARRTESIAQKGVVQSKLDALELSAPGEATAQELEHAKARALEKAEEAATLRASLWLLARAREKAGEGSRPLIDAASGYFERLTGGAYTGLEIDRGGKEPRLWAQPASGPAKDLAALSDGTRDQIWFALRLAVVRKAARKTPFPLLLDDVFVHFDDVRTTRALRLLHELSEELQVVIFTHHDHLLDLARQSCGDGLAEVVLACPESPKGERVLPAERERHERPAPPVAAVPEPSGRAARGGGDAEEAAEAVLEALRAAAEPLSKSEVLEAIERQRGLQLGTSAWNATIKALKEQNAVVQEGEKKGARYRLSE